jgi:DNA-binding winged helix-turn-helix (wHTH) protein
MVHVFGDFELDEPLCQLRRSREVVPVEPQAFKLLVYLLAHRDRVVTREELFDNLWPGQVVGDAALTYCVTKARKAVQDTGAQQHIIKTVHGYGYRFIGQVARSQQAVVSRPEEERQEVPISFHSLALIPRTQPPTPTLVDHESVVITQSIWPSLRSSLQSRQFVMVCCLFVCGWFAALGKMAVQSSILLQPSWPVVVEATSDLAQAEGKLCHWWIVAAKNQAALDALLKGWEYYDRSTPEAAVQARWMFQRAIEFDPTYAAAYASLGWMAWQEWLSWSQNPNSLEQASLYLQKAATLDSSCTQTITWLAEVRLMQKRQAQMMATVEHVIGEASISMR